VSGRSVAASLRGLLPLSVIYENTTVLSMGDTFAAMLLLSMVCY
jgi:hypothetical protein